MKRLIIYFLFIFSFSLKSQSWVWPPTDCNPSSVVVTSTDIFPPNSTTSYSGTGSPYTSVAYLCGPNTILYDTIAPHAYYVFVNAGCTYITNGGCSIYYEVFYIKNGGTLVLKPDFGPCSLWIMTEPTATIINQSTVSLTSNVSVTSGTCASITFPIVSCSTGMLEIKKEHSFFQFSPNPALEKISINLRSNDVENIELTITDYLGQKVYENKNWTIAEKEIPIKEIPAGLYSIQMKTMTFRQTEKLIIAK